VATEELDMAEGQLNAEADEDAGLRSQHGSAWNRPASAALNSSLREKVASYRHARHTTAHGVLCSTCATRFGKQLSSCLLSALIPKG